MKKGRVLAAILAATMLISTLSSSSVYMAAPTDVSPIESTVAEKFSTDADQVAEFREKLNYQDVELDLELSFSDEVDALTSRNWGALPESYSSSVYVDWDFEKVNNYVTPIKDQNPFGTCWAHATIAAAEATYIINNGITDVESVDFNEYHLVHYTYDIPNDPLGLFGGDYNELTTGEEYLFLDSGGNNGVSAQILANWVGVSDDTEFGANDVEGNHSDAFAFEDAAHLENSYFIFMPDMYSTGYQADMNMVKNALMEYGALAVSYGSYYEGGDEGSGYYYCPYEGPTNHAVTLIGWDDSIPAETFESPEGYIPAGDGGWLIKNSWGDYGELDGYFWLSYYDGTIASIAYSYDMVDADNYDNNYQYDGSGVYAAYYYTPETICSANAFVADSNETLEAVGFYTYDTNVDYEVHVYTDLEENEAPQYGDLVLTQTGTEIYAGYHTVELDSNVNLEEGERYAVVITLSKEGYYSYAAIDVTDSYGWLNFYSYAKAGESYIGNDVDSLEDCNAGYTEYADGVNVKIKAYTNERKVDPSRPTGITLNATSLQLYKGDKTAITATVTPSTAENKAVAWSSSNTSVATVDANGKVTAVGVGTAVITATSKEDSNISASCTITVKPVLVSAITLNKTALELLNGNSETLTATVTPSTAENKAVTWSSSNTSVATVNANGKVTAVGKGTAVITATAKDGSGKSASCTVTVTKKYADGINEYTDGKLYYFKDDKIDTTYTGVADYKGDTWYVKNGAVDTSVNGLKQVGKIWYLFKGGKVNRITTLASYGGSWWYVENGQINFGYDGVANYDGKTWYIENGQVDFSKKGLHQRGSNWYYFKGGYVDYSFTGLTNSSVGWWYIEKGTITFKYTGLVQYGGSWWYVSNSQLNFKYDGVANHNGSTWYIEDSKVDFSKNGLHQRGKNWYYFKGGAVDYKYTGLTDSSVGWWYIEKGTITFKYTGLTNYNGSWWYVSNSQLNFKYDGVANHNGSTWYIEDSKVDFKKNGLYQRGGKWYYFKNGAVNYKYTGLTNSSVGWWYIQNGTITFKYTGLTNYNGSWWYVSNSQLNFKYDGVANHNGATWYIEDSKVDFKKNGLHQRGGVWYLFKNGAVNKIDSVEPYGGSWWYVDDGIIDFNYNGLGRNASGLWYIKKGKVDFSCNGIYEINGKSYKIVNGKATLITDKTCLLPTSSAYYKYEYAYKNGGNTSGFTSAEKAFYNGLAACLNEAYKYKTPFEREKAVHDYMVLNCEYDMQLVNTGKVSSREVYSPEGVFKNKVAVCDGYSKAFKLCMDILGIECIRVTGTANGGGHAWNAVKLDNEWYMVDVTWDDPIPDEKGRVLYNYFNVTDEQLKRDHEYTCDIKATGTKYNYLRMQENYVTNITDYYAYLNKIAPTLETGEVIMVIVELNNPWTRELLYQYMDSSKVTTGEIYCDGALYSTHVAEFYWYKP